MKTEPKSLALRSAWRRGRQAARARSVHATGRPINPYIIRHNAKQLTAFIRSWSEGYVEQMKDRALEAVFDISPFVEDRDREAFARFANWCYAEAESESERDYTAELARRARNG